MTVNSGGSGVFGSSGAGFQSPTTGGQGTLLEAQIKSPNFNLSNKTGWAILRNGNAYFFNITATGTIIATEFEGTDFFINSEGAYFYSPTPGSGNLIATITNQPVGSTDPYGNDTYPGIASYNETLDTIAQLFDGQLLLFGPGTGIGSGAQADLYAGPQTYLVSGGSLTIVGAAALTNTAAVMNLYDSGAGDGTAVVEINNAALTLGNIGAVPATPPQNSAALYGNTGYVKFISSQDSNAYVGGFLLGHTTSEQDISSTNQNGITNLSVNVADGITYYFRANLAVKGLSTNDAYLSMGGTTTATSFRASITYLGTGQNVVVQQTTLGSNTGLNSNALVNGDFYDVVIEGYLVATANGTLQVEGAASANATSYGVLAGSTLFVSPIV
jgi:hypothetical protein